MHTHSWEVDKRRLYFGEVFFVKVFSDSASFIDSSSIFSTYLFTEYYCIILGCVQVDHYTRVSPYSYTNNAVGS